MKTPAFLSGLSRNDRTVLACVGVVATMIGLAYASAPLYELFCRVTGFDGTPQIADEASTEVIDRVITVRFDSNTMPALPWAFQPEQRQVQIKVGENGLVFYRAQNRADRPVSGTATFNVTPEKAGPYFVKLQCFCFTEQRLEPGQSVDMPVSFYVDPAIADDPDLDDLTAITLSYTFFPYDHQEQAAAALPAPARP